LKHGKEIMQEQRWVSLAFAGLVVYGLSAACSSEAVDDGAGSAGKSGGSSAKGGETSAGKGGSSTAGGKANAGAGGAGAAGEAATAGADSSAAGAGGGGVDATAGASGEGGAGGSETLSCDTVRSELLGAIDTVSTGLVENISQQAETFITLRIDASAGGYMAAATNPYIYVKLAEGTRAELSDVSADSSLDWDIALKRDNLRSNGGDSGSGAAEVAVIDGVDFGVVSSSAVATADFAADAFVDPATCQAITDAIGKPLTRFDGWYEYEDATMKLSPADRVYLIRDAHGSTVFKLQILGYYIDVPDGSGGTVSKSAVYTLRYAAL
jgi:hypothetical protein